MAQRRITAEAQSFPLARPFRISRGVKSVADVVMVTVEENGIVGRGEGVPYPRYGETVEGSLQQIEDQRDLIESGGSRLDLLAAMPAGAARNALDCALWDLELRQSGKGIFAELGLPKPDRVETAFTVGLDTPEAMRKAASELAHVPLIKVKVDRSDPAAKLRAVREAAPRPKVIVDPNESWTMEEVVGLQDLMADLRFDLLEQPLPAEDDGELAGFQSRIPIAADEAIHTSADLTKLPSGYSVVNIKLDKTGGFTEALNLARAAKAAGYDVMTGCMICSSLSIAPALALTPLSKFVDVDGPLWLAEDREGGVTEEGGYLYGPAAGFWGAA